jgi:DNA-3-methyladenine glycosylase I
MSAEIEIGMRTKRCAWVDMDDPLLVEYHDREWGVPVHDDCKHFEFLVLEASQAGLLIQSLQPLPNTRREWERNRFDPPRQGGCGGSRREG